MSGSVGALSVYVQSTPALGFVCLSVRILYLVWRHCPRLVSAQHNHPLGSSRQLSTAESFCAKLAAMLVWKVGKSFGATGDQTVCSVYCVAPISARLVSCLARELTRFCRASGNSMPREHCDPLWPLRRRNSVPMFPHPNALASHDQYNIHRRPAYNTRTMIRFFCFGLVILRRGHGFRSKAASGDAVVCRRVVLVTCS